MDNGKDYLHNPTTFFEHILLKTIKVINHSDIYNHKQNQSRNFIFIFDIYGKVI